MAIQRGPGTGGGAWAMANIWFGLLVPYYLAIEDDTDYERVCAQLIRVAALCCLVFSHFELVRYVQRPCRTPASFHS